MDKFEVLVVLISVVAVTMCREISDEGKIDVVQAIQPQPRALISLGANGAGEFYADPAQSLTWFEAREFCSNQLGALPQMTLAKVLTNPNDFTWLIGAYQITILGKGRAYWTQGRDLQDWPRFAWDSDPTTPLKAGEGSSPLPYPQTGFKTCLAFGIMTTGAARLIPYDCTTKLPPLCQAPTPGGP